MATFMPPPSHRNSGPVHSPDFAGELPDPAGGSPALPQDSPPGVRSSRFPSRFPTASSSDRHCLIRFAGKSASFGRTSLRRLVEAQETWPEDVLPQHQNPFPTRLP